MDEQKHRELMAILIETNKMVRALIERQELVARNLKEVVELMEEQAAKL